MASKKEVRIGREGLESWITERDLQKLLVKYLQLHGYHVLEIGAFHYRVRCPHCQQLFSPKTGYGNTPGSPDIYFSHPSWPEGVWVGVELKRPQGGRVRAVQRGLVETGRTFIIRRLEELEALLHRVGALFSERQKGEEERCPEDANTSS